MVLISRVGFEKLIRFEKESSNISSSHFSQPRLNSKANRLFQSNGSGKKRKTRRKKIFTFAVSNNLKCELLFRRSYVFYNIVLYEKIEHDKFMGGSFFFKFKLVVI